MFRRTGACKDDRCGDPKSRPRVPLHALQVHRSWPLGDASTSPCAGERQPEWHHERLWAYDACVIGPGHTGGAEGTRTPDPSTARPRVPVRRHPFECKAAGQIRCRPILGLDRTAANSRGLASTATRTAPLPSPRSTLENFGHSTTDHYMRALTVRDVVGVHINPAAADSSARP